MAIFNRDKRTEYHTITCDHPFMIDIGMNSFTLPEILEWWNFKDGTDQYVNRKFFPFTPTLADIIDPLPRMRNSYHIKAWRFEKYNAGNYIDYRITTGLHDADTELWEFYNNSPEAPAEEASQFSLLDINLLSYTNKKFDRIEKDLVDIELPLSRDIPAAVANLVAMNDFYNIKGFGDTDQDKASSLFLKDVRRSKNSGYISWSGVVPLFVNVLTAKLLV